MPAAQREYGDPDEIEHHRRHVHHVVGPVAPARQKSMKVAEDFFGPEINAALARITMRQFDDGDALRPKKQQQRDDPEPDRDATIGRDRRHNIEIEDGDDEKKHEVETAEDAA